MARSPPHPDGCPHAGSPSQDGERQEGEGEAAAGAIPGGPGGDMGWGAHGRCGERCRSSPGCQPSLRQAARRCGCLLPGKVPVGDRRSREGGWLAGRTPALGAKPCSLGSAPMCPGVPVPEVTPQHAPGRGASAISQGPAFWYVGSWRSTGRAASLRCQGLGTELGVSVGPRCLAGMLPLPGHCRQHLAASQAAAIPGMRGGLSPPSASHHVVTKAPGSSPAKHRLGAAAPISSPGWIELMGPWARTVRCFPAVDQDIQGDTEGTRHVLGAGACGWQSGIAVHHSLWLCSFQLCPLCGVHQSKQFPWEAESQF